MGSPQNLTDRRSSMLVLMVQAAWRPAIVIALVAAVILIVRPRQLVSEIAEFREWIDSYGIWGVGLFIVLYMLAAVAIVPASLLKVAAGGMFGSVEGVILASIGSTLGATACFLIARYVARGTLVQRLKQREQYRKLDELSTQHGALIVALVRLVPVLPSNLVNYAFGLTHVPLRTFVFWSWLCTLPSTVVLVVSTDAFVQGVEEDRPPWVLVAVAGGALVLMLGGMVLAHRTFKTSRSSREQSAARTTDA